MSRAVVTATWADVPHLTPEVQKDLYDTIVKLHPHQADARSKGVPSLGSGVIYPFSEDILKIDPFDPPPHWPRAFGLDGDAGAGWTAIVWGAINTETQTLYIYDCYKSSHRELSLHVAALKDRGEWMAGVGDAKSLIVTEHDSHEVIELYKKAGIDVDYPDKAVEAGIYQVFELMVPQRLKVTSNCKAWFEEQRLYRRDEKGRIVKKNDHLMDATRYLVRSGLARAKRVPVDKPKQKQFFVVDQATQGTGWMS